MSSPFPGCCAAVVRRRSQQSLNPSKWRLGVIAMIGMLFLRADFVRPIH